MISNLLSPSTSDTSPSPETDALLLALVVLIIAVLVPASNIALYSKVSLLNSGEITQSIYNRLKLDDNKLREEAKKAMVKIKCNEINGSGFFLNFPYSFHCYYGY